MVDTLRDTLIDNGKFTWSKFSEKKYVEAAGFDTTKELLEAAQKEADLEVNAFYQSVRYRPTKKQRNVEVGRVAVITYGEDYGKQAVITDIVDQARVVVMGVDGLLSDIKPRSFPLKRLHLTGVRVNGLTQRGHRLKKVKALLNASLEDIKKNVMADRVVKQIGKRRSKVRLTDFEKFKKWA